MAIPNPPTRPTTSWLLVASIVVFLSLLLSLSHWSMPALGQDPAVDEPETPAEGESGNVPLPHGPDLPAHRPGLPAVLGPGGLRTDGDHPVRTREPEPLRLGRSRLYPARPGLAPNELGRVLILMYHRIGEPESTWQRTPENLRGDLERLYDLGYRAVSLEDYLRGDIDLPAGTSPVVITFDDGTQGQFRYLVDEEGNTRMDPDSAVGILRDFYTQHPDFGLEATFFVNGYTPFGQPEFWQDKLQDIVALGMDLGNHTYAHANLGNLSAAEIEMQLARCVEHIQKAVPGYQPVGLALPFGSLPKPSQRQALFTGEYDGVSYSNLTALLVGSQPAPSPYSPDFDPSILPRVRASGEYLDRWLEHFEQNPTRRFVSDGDPNQVARPAQDEPAHDPSS